MCQWRRKIRLIEVNETCRHLKKLTYSIKGLRGIYVGVYQSLSTGDSKFLAYIWIAFPEEHFLKKDQTDLGILKLDIGQ